MSGDSVIFRGVRVILPDRITPPCALRIERGRIARVETEEAATHEIPSVRADGLYAAPGLIDVHCHSDGKRDFFQYVNAVAHALLREGTTGVLATLAYCDMKPGQLDDQVEAFWTARDELARAVILGVHLEGPYINPKYGALVNSAQVHPPAVEEYRPVLDRWAEVVRLWTVAPELPGAGEFITAAAARGIVLAAGHTEASAEEVQPWIPKGLRLATHWSNATGRPRSRHAGTVGPGVDELALLHEGMTAEVICDSQGCHVHPLMLRLLYRVKGPDGIVLISDAYWDSDGTAETDPDDDVHFTADGLLNGSKLTMLAAVRNFRKHVGCGLPELFRMGALNPAKIFGWADDMGSLELGKLANILLIDENLALRGVWLAGRPVETHTIGSSWPAN